MRTFHRAQPPCRHRGDYEQHVGCNCPSGAVAAFECLLHEACCTLFKQSTDADVRHCLTCNDREAISALNDSLLDRDREHAGPGGG